MKQLITVSAKKKTIKLKENWKTLKTIKAISIGKNGVTKNKKEGDQKTPLGLFKLGPAFGKEKTKIKYPYIKITPNTYYIDDQNSKYYNKWVEINGKLKTPYSYIINKNKITWESSEHLIEYKEYDLGIIIEYNIEKPDNQKGSAIFIHIKNHPYTKGCIALNKEDLEYILNWLDKTKNPHILIKG